MKKIIISSMAFIALLLTNAQADFNFENILKDMKDAATTMTKDAEDSSVVVSSDISSAVKTVSDDSKASAQSARSVSKNTNVPVKTI
ncbi:hypothetical protein [Sulfurovum sp.]|uniref:hypothetical protein n=1 Tax=Sulfurovum sp. TaxID=1969726 RepID=UPI002867BD14|nr:hypothetical protein [Sulfurovum sp.]